jgi:hypothetical protein
MDRHLNQPYWLLRDGISQRTAKGALDYPVFELAPVLPRTDNLDIFDEGALFSGVSETAGALACVTSVASAHVPSTVPTSEYVDAARAVFGRDARLPEAAKEISTLPPQAIIWWSLKTEAGISTSSDFIELSALDPKEQIETCKLIAGQTAKSVELIERLKGSAIIWGAWGNGTRPERELTGMSRGVPTNKIGHSHVVHLDEARRLMTPKGDITTKEAANFADAWTTPLHEHFGEPIARMLDTVLAGTDLPAAKLTHVAAHNTAADSLVQDYGGLLLDFGRHVPYSEALRAMTVVARTLEDMYQGMVDAHGRYYRAMGNPQLQTAIKSTLSEYLTRQVFTADTASAMTDFVLGVRPTMVQLEQWQDESNPELTRLLERYHRVAIWLGRTPTHSSILFETMASSFRPVADVAEIDRTLAVHASAWYLVEEPRLQDGTVYTARVRIYPTISSFVAAPERILGGIERRTLAAS